MNLGRFSIEVLTAGALMLTLRQAANADLFEIGSTVTVMGTDVTNSSLAFSNNVLLQDGSTPIDNGALNLTLSMVPEGNSEWLIFSYQTAKPGTPLTANTQNDWNASESDFDAAMALDFTGAFVEFLDSSGNVLTPTSSVLPGYSVVPNPIPGGAGFGLGFKDLDPLEPNFAIGANINPFDLLDGTGVPSANVDGWVQALEFSPQVTSVPEPSFLAIIAGALLGLGVMRQRR